MNGYSGPNTPMLPDPPSVLSWVNAFLSNPLTMNASTNAVDGISPSGSMIRVLVPLELYLLGLVSSAAMAWSFLTLRSASSVLPAGTLLALTPMSVMPNAGILLLVSTFCQNFL